MATYIMYIVIAEIVIILMLIWYNLYVKRRLKVVKRGQESLKKLSAFKEIIDITGTPKNVDEKLNEVNNSLINNLGVTNSHIVVFTGINYDIKASNIEEKNKKELFNVIRTKIFQNSILEDKPKFLKTDKNMENMPYAVNRKIGASKFYPLYENCGFLGYWLVESEDVKGLDYLDEELMEKIKKSILSIISTLFYQKATQTFIRKDSVSNTNSKEHLLIEGRNRLEQKEESTIVMFNITNILEVNKEYSREIGNEVIRKVGELLNYNYNEFVYSRYIGPKFVVILDGMKRDDESTKITISRLENDIKNIRIVQDKNNKLDNLENLDSLDEINEVSNYVHPEVKIEYMEYKKGYELDTVLIALEEKIEGK